MNRSTEIIEYRNFASTLTRRNLIRIGVYSLLATPAVAGVLRAFSGGTIETASSEGNILFMNGGKIEVKFGVDIPTEDRNGNVYQTQYLPGTAHPDITISNPIIVLQKNDKGEILTYYRFFYRSDWRLISAKEAKTIKEADNERNGYAVSTKIPTEYGKPAQLILSNGKVMDQTIDGDNN